jgi:hypothetical protein
LQTAPAVIYFPPSTSSGRSDPIFYSLASLEAEALLEWISALAKQEFSLVKPFNYVKLITMISIVLGIAFVIKIFYNSILSVIQNSSFWSIVSLVFIINMNAGYMWNQIRGAAYAPSKGSIFRPEFQSQYAIESQVVAVLCILF